jgi:hypothetical protein
MLVGGIIGTTLGLVKVHALHERELLLNKRARQVIEALTSDTAIEQLTARRSCAPSKRISWAR